MLMEVSGNARRCAAAKLKYREVKARRMAYIDDGAGDVDPRAGTPCSFHWNPR
jgi:hypothetical protein